MPLKFPCLILLFYFSSLTCFAQKNLKEAIIVFNNSDTSKGYIDYKEWFSTPSSISFTTDRNKPVTRFGVNELSYFEVEGVEQYKRYTVRISLDNEAMSSIGNKDTSSEIRVVFLKILQKGKNVSLFSYRDGLKKRLYLLHNNDATPVELQNSVYMLNDQVKEERQYRSMLLGAASKYLPGDARIMTQISNAGYYDDAIGNICLKLNGMDKAPVKTQAKMYNQSKWRFFVGAGISRYTLKMSGSNIYSGKTTYPFYAPVGAVGADLVINPAVGKLILRGQLHVNSYKTNAYVFKDFDQYTEQYFFKFRQVNIAFEPQLLYNLYNQKELKWFVSAGVGLNFSSYPLNEEKFIRTSSTNAEAFDDNYLKSLKKFGMNGCFSTGIDFSRLELAFLYYPASAVTRTAAYGLDNSSMQLRVNFYIKK